MIIFGIRWQWHHPINNQSGNNREVWGNIPRENEKFRNYKKISHTTWSFLDQSEAIFFTTMIKTSPIRSYILFIYLFMADMTWMYLFLSHHVCIIIVAEILFMNEKLWTKYHSKESQTTNEIYFWNHQHGSSASLYMSIFGTIWLQLFARLQLVPFDHQVSNNSPNGKRPLCEP